MANHAKLSASASHRWFACPGSIRLSEGIEQTTSIYAEEGTKAHDIAAAILEGRDYELPEGLVVLPIREYVEYVNSIPYDIRLIEHKFDLSSIYPGMFGTSDCTIYQKDKKHLHVIDLKFGKGVFVHAKDNPQLLYYALGAFNEIKKPIDIVSMTIVQPRFKSEEKIRTHSISSIELFDWSIDLIEAAKKTEDKNSPLVKGRHCQFCPAKPTCPEFTKSKLEEAISDFSSFQKEISPVQSDNAISFLDYLEAARHGSDNN